MTHHLRVAPAAGPVAPGIGLAEVRAAAQRIQGAVLRTPTVQSDAVSRATGARVFLKLDGLQATGAFKERGAANRIALLTARERQSFIEGRIAELETVIPSVEVIDVGKLSGDQVKFGARVTIVDEESDEEKTYRIVGAHEADMKLGSISLSSPLAKALIGKKVGDSVEVPAPGGARAYEITDVRFR